MRETIARSGASGARSVASGATRVNGALRPASQASSLGVAGGPAAVGMAVMRVPSTVSCKSSNQAVPLPATNSEITIE